MDINLAVVKGDGIGPEIVTEAEKVLDKIGEMMENADPKEREALKECMRAIERA